MDSELVNQIVQQVIAAMKQQGSSPAVAAAPARAVRLQEFTGGGNPVLKSRADKKPAQTAPERVFVTAQMLSQRLAASARGGMIELKHNEYLTPAAKDLADDKHLSVHRAAPNIAQACPVPAQDKPQAMSAEPIQTAMQAACGGIGVVLEKPDAKVQTVLSAAAREGLEMTVFGNTSCWMRNLRQLCQAITDGQKAIGVAILPYASDAMVLAAKIKGVRPVQGTRTASVEAAVRHYGANLLVLEHAFCTLHEMKQMIRQFAHNNGRKGIAEALLGHIAEAEKRS